MSIPTAQHAPRGITVRDMPYIVMHLHAPRPLFRLFRENPPTTTLTPCRRATEPPRQARGLEPVETACRKRPTLSVIFPRFWKSLTYLKQNDPLIASKSAFVR
jgi:hypothetical protein